MTASRKVLLLGALTALCAAACIAQYRSGGGRTRFSRNEDDGPITRLEGGGWVNQDTVRTAREIPSHSTGTPNWTNPPGFDKDVFTFARIVFRTAARPGSDAGRGGDYRRGYRLGWWVDFPDADLNLSYRLQQLTSMKVDPDARVVRLTDPDLCDYPLLYGEHPGYMQLSEPEVAALRNHLLSGGVLFINDFWSAPEWDGFARQMKRVLPERDWTELSISHPLFHCVFDLQGPMKKLQVPTIQFWNPYYDPNDPESHLQRIDRGEGSEDMHVRAWLDDRQRIMIVVIHNSDVSDGWEREGENDYYFHTFSEKISYPLGMNIVFYLMTH
jgi:hypothetical protein